MIVAALEHVRSSTPHGGGSIEKVLNFSIYKTRSLGALDK